MKKKILISSCLLGTPCRYDGKSVRRVDVTALSERYELVPICPEVDGGLPTPRTPSERLGDRVVMRDGTDVTENFLLGAEHAYAVALEHGCEIALLKERSPSCGKDVVYDGSFTSTLTERGGVTAEYLSARGIRIFGENDIDELLK